MMGHGQGFAIVGLTTVAFFLAAGACARGETTRASASTAGTTRIARWKDDRKAAFCLMFDDSIPTDVKNVVPELKKRGMVGTFYVNPGKPQWKRFAEAWEKQIPAAGMEYANHTMTHTGATSEAQLEEEVSRCNEVIRRVAPGPWPRLISFGQPGVPRGKWTVSEAQVKAVLARHHLIDRGTFGGHGAAVAFKDAAAIIKLMDQALAKGQMQYVVFHGVGGDYITFPMDQFVKVLDALQAHRDDLWVAGHIAAYKYATERDTAEVHVVKSEEKRIELKLTCQADPKLYDAPLTLLTQTPRSWRWCRIAQGPNVTTTAVTEGVVRYDALPDGQVITLEPGEKR
jgi:peptidoglycan/xylan/chitin deacetylase (PgdA/CDA1 family)